MIFAKKETDDLKRHLTQAQRIYREPIEIQRKSKPTQNPDGTWPTSEWQTWKKVFANATNLHGAEYFAAGQTSAQGTIKFYIPYMPGISNEIKESYRILYRGKTYNIEFIDNIKYCNEELEIKANERVITDGSD